MARGQADAYVGDVVRIAEITNGIAQQVDLTSGAYWGRPIEGPEEGFRYACGPRPKEVSKIGRTSCPPQSCNLHEDGQYHAKGVPADNELRLVGYNLPAASLSRVCGIESPLLFGSTQHGILARARLSASSFPRALLRSQTAS